MNHSRPSFESYLPYFQSNARLIAFKEWRMCNTHQLNADLISSLYLLVYMEFQDL